MEFSPEDDIPEQEVERLLLAPPKTNIENMDPFVDTMINEEVSDILPLTLDRDALRELDPTTILIAKWPMPLKTRYYRNLMPEWQISMCPECLQVSLVFIDLKRLFLLKLSCNCLVCTPFSRYFIPKTLNYRFYKRDTVHFVALILRLY